ncbi:unnamed protein product [Adineta ricciae]|uniref:Phenolic acid decarboxylase n=1 Tax=Adineta ricciae TaxID=249248 RepID=A0A814T6G0_ADIRI|nr:unnamed protein product [Adineta ricciae]
MKVRLILGIMRSSYVLFTFPTNPQDIYRERRSLYSFYLSIETRSIAESLNIFLHDERISIVGGRWVKDQEVHLVKLSSAEDIFKLSWTEPTGTSVSLSINLNERRLHGTIFFPRWVMNEPQKTICFQNDHLDEMCRYRDCGPTYPIEVIDEFAQIMFVEDCRANDETIIACASSELPSSYIKRLN